MPILAWNVPLVSLIFLKRSLVFPILLFFFIYLCYSFKKAFLSLLAILWNSAFSWEYLSLSPLLSVSLLLSAKKVSLDNPFAFLHFFFLGMVLATTFCTVLQTSIHSSSGTLSNLVPWIYSSPPLYNHRFDLVIPGWFMVFPTFFKLEFCKKKLMIWATAPGLVFAVCITLLHLRPQRT